MPIAASHATRLLLMLDACSRSLPSHGTFEPYYNARSWDFRDLMRTFRTDAVRNGELVWTACEAYANRSKWPRMKGEPAFWLRERWWMAERYCREVAKNSEGGTTQAAAEESLPMNAIMRHVVIEMWDKRFVDVWLQENARDYVRLDSYADTNSQVEFEIEMRIFEGSLRRVKKAGA